MTDIKLRVANGMAWLDDHYPGHAEYVDLGNLAVAHGFYCPLAQAARTEYDDAVYELGLDEETQVGLGFVTVQEGYSAINAEWGALTEEWRRQYRERFASLEESDVDVIEGWVRRGF